MQTLASRIAKAPRFDALSRKVRTKAFSSPNSTSPAFINTHLVNILSDYKRDIMTSGRPPGRTEREIAHNQELERRAAKGDSYAQKRVRTNAYKNRQRQIRREAAESGDQDAMRKREKELATARSKWKRQHEAEKKRRQSGDEEAIARRDKRNMQTRMRNRAKRAPGSARNAHQMQNHATDEACGTLSDDSEPEDIGDYTATSALDNPRYTLRRRACGVRDLSMNSYATSNDLGRVDGAACAVDAASPPLRARELIDIKEEEEERKDGADERNSEIIYLSSDDEKPAFLTSRTAINVEATTRQIHPAAKERNGLLQVQTAGASRPFANEQARRKREIELKLEQARQAQRAAALELELLQFEQDE